MVARQFVGGDEARRTIISDALVRVCSKEADAPELHAKLSSLVHAPKRAGSELSICLPPPAEDDEAPVPDPSDEGALSLKTQTSHPPSAKHRASLTPMSSSIKSRRPTFSCVDGGGEADVSGASPSPASSFQTSFSRHDSRRRAASLRIESSEDKAMPTAQLPRSKTTRRSIQLHSSPAT